MDLATFFAIFILGTLLTEGVGYVWHRFVCHSGILRSVLHELMRRRHFDHHVHKYPAGSVSQSAYVPSCDISFRVIGVALVLTILAIAGLGAIHVSAALTLLLAVLLHAVLGGKLHALYHLDDTTLSGMRFCRWKLSYKAVVWLRDFHEIHHVANANYSLFIPFFDLIGFSFISPSRLGSLQEENLFPRFDATRSSSCDERLF